MYKVVIVDDERYSHEYIKEWVQKISNDFEVSACLTDGKEAVEYINRNKVDIILTDVKMPVMSGLELAEYIYKSGLDISVIIISGYEDFDYARKAIKYGVFSYLVKSFDFNELSDVMIDLKERLDEKNEYREIKSDSMSELREKFFAESFVGFYKDVNEMKAHYNQLGFKNEFEEVMCSIYDITIENYENVLHGRWQYGKDDFEKSIVRMLEAVFNETEDDIYILSFNRDLVKCIILTKQNKDYSIYIVHKVKDVLDLDISVKRKSKETSVSSIDEITEWIDKNILIKMIVSYIEFGKFEKAKYIIENYMAESDIQNEMITGKSEYEGIVRARGYS